MQYSIHIETLSPLHIGSGRELLANYEYLYFGKQATVILAKEEKIMEIFGKEDIGEWLDIIEKKGDLLKALFSRTDSLNLNELAHRKIAIKGDSKPDNSQNIKEQLFNGMGKPLVPGSSLKGAIRTAVFAANLHKQPDLVRNNYLITREKYVKGQKATVFQDNGLEKKLLGSDPNHDIFRLLRVGDVLFSDTEAFRSYSVNKGREGWFVSDKISAFMECIPAQRESLLQISIPDDLIKQAQKQNYFAQNTQQLQLKKLFATINDHTQKLLNNELAFWSQDKAKNKQIVNEYIIHLQQLIASAKQCQEGECILRLGGGSGVDFMTGDWQEALLSPDNYEKWVKQFRGSAFELGFPKTRRLAHNQSPIGFVRLKMVSANEKEIIESRLAAMRYEAQKVEAVIAQKADQRLEEFEPKVPVSVILKTPPKTKEEKIILSSEQAEEIEFEKIIDNQTIFKAKVIDAEKKKVRLLIKDREIEAQIGMGIYKMVALENGQIVKVICKSRVKGEIKQVSYVMPDIR